MFKAICIAMVLFSHTQSVRAFDNLGGFGIDWGGLAYRPPTPTCRYSFYVGRYWIQITDMDGVKRDCQYTGYRGAQSIYDCRDGNTVTVQLNQWRFVSWVHFDGPEDIAAYCY